MPPQARCPRCESLLPKGVPAPLCPSCLLRLGLENRAGSGEKTPPRVLFRGAALGPYQIVAGIGQGGMGEVYRALDPRLGREVAVKVIRSDAPLSADRLRRFEREARLVAALEHPNVLAVHDVGIQDGLPYLVCELLEGETLANRLTRGALPARQVMATTVQLCHGLAAAHAKGLVHRDLKPENIFVLADGRVKVLDFGIAKLWIDQDLADAKAPAQTSTTGAMLLGTPSYMSPEQVRRLPADARSDIFALGAVMYEMISGQRAFQRPTDVETLSAVLNEEPPEPQTSGPTLAGLNRVVRCCLEKSPEQRYQAARDVALALEAVSSATAPSTGAEAMAPRSRGRSAMGLAILLLAPLGFWLGRATGLIAGRTAAVPTLRQLTFRRGLVSNARFSRDGHTILYDAAWDGRRHEVFSTRLDTVESRPLGTAAASVVATSDGEVIVLLDDGRLAKVPLVGGPLREVADGVRWADSVRGTTAVVRVTGDRWRLECPIGRVLYEPPPPAQITELRLSPQGDRIAFADITDSTSYAGSIALVDRSGNKTVLSTGWEDVEGLAWSPSGEEVWFTAATTATSRALHAVALRGSQRALLRMAGSLRLQDIFPDGRVLLTHTRNRWEMAGLFPGDAREHDYSWLDGTVSQGLTPDGRMVAFQEWGEGGGPLSSSYVRRTDGSPAIRLGDGGAVAFSDDGRFVLATLDRPPPRRLTLIPTGPGETRILPRGTIDRYIVAGFDKAAKRAVIVGHERGRPVRTFIQDLPGGVPRAVTPEGVRPWSVWCLFSPDGRLMASRGGQSEIKSWAFYPIDGGQPESIAWLKDGEVPLRLSADGRFAYVQETMMPARISRLDLRTRQRQPWKELAPSDPTGVTFLWNIVPTPDGQYYVYSYPRDLSDLYLVDGLR